MTWIISTNNRALCPAPVLAACVLVICLAVCPAEAADYTVRPGDSLGSIARQQLGDEARWPQIADLNRLAAPYTIRAGDKLQLPGMASLSAAGQGASDEVDGGLAKFPGVARVLAIAGIGVLVLGGIIYIVGFFLFEIAAFRKGFWWGVGTLIVQPVWLVFLVKHWESAKKGFIYQVVASVLLCGGLTLLWGCGMWAAITQNTAIS